jgi:dTDP-4-amino-4,6-dideoxygalactose transaminase
MLRDWGQSERYCHTLRGFNYRMDAIQGAALNVKLRHLDQWTAQRRAVAGAYEDALADTPIQRAAPTGDDHVWHVYAVRVRDRDAVRQELTARGIMTGIHYPVPVHLQPAYSDLGYGAGDFPMSEQLASEFLSLPIYPELTGPQIDAVCDALRATVLEEVCHVG